jgi:hypothetical protein
VQLEDLADVLLRRPVTAPAVKPKMNCVSISCLPSSAHAPGCAQLSSPTASIGTIQQLLGSIPHSLPNSTTVPGIIVYLRLRDHAAYQQPSLRLHHSPHWKPGRPTNPPTGGTVVGAPFHVDLDDLHMHTLTARLSILLDRSSTASTK